MTTYHCLWCREDRLDYLDPGGDCPSCGSSLYTGTGRLSDAVPEGVVCWICETEVWTGQDFALGGSPEAETLRIWTREAGEMMCPGCTEESR